MMPLVRDRGVWQLLKCAGPHLRGLRPCWKGCPSSCRTSVLTPVAKIVGLDVDIPVPEAIFSELPMKFLPLRRPPTWNSYSLFR